MRLPNTLFLRTSLTLSGALLLFMLFTGFVIFHYILQPVGKRSASDLAALMVLSAKTWTELPPQAREDFQEELQAQHKLVLMSHPPEGELRPLVLHSPYMLFLEQALSSNMGQPRHLLVTGSRPGWYWAALPVAGHTLYAGLHHDHIGAQPPRAAFIILLGASLFILLTTLLVVRRITRPLEALSRGVMRLGSSGQHLPLPETGPDELARLARKFNQLSGEIRQLLENRTVLLGGISHDLRTPLARLRIIVELLEKQADPELLGNMQKDLEEMDSLIARTLELARLMQGKEIPSETVDLGDFLRNLGSARSSEQIRIEVQTPDHCRARLSPVILQRVLNNLLDNAILHAGKEHIRLHLECRAQHARICVLDDGPGIPGDQLDKVCQPFYRLEPSRNLSTGGSGLGLAVAQQLCQLNGWQLFLKNRPDGGLSACVSIPSCAP